jgi:hypothetical protein
MLAVGGIHSANGGTKARSLFYGVALRVNKIGIACKGIRLLQKGPSYIGRSMVAVDLRR